MTNLVLPFTGQSNWDNTLNTALTALNDGKAEKSDAVTVTGNQTIAGDKTFTGLTTLTGLPPKDLKYAIELSGSNGSNVSLGVKTYLDGAQPFTFGTWIDFYSNALTDDATVWAYGYSNTNDKGYVARVDGATKKLQFFWGASTNQATANNTFCYGKMWLVLTYDGANTLKVFKNNVLMDTLTIAARNADSAIGSYLGTRDATARNLNGALDDSFLYNRVLSADELTSIFRTATFPTSGNLFLYHFDERTGTVATDSSGSGNNGTINAGTYRVSAFGNPNRAPSAPITWQASLANADLAKTCAVFLGSSTTQGADSSTLDTRYTDVLGTLLHRNFNSASVPGGKHIRGTDAGWNTTGTTAQNSDGLGLGSTVMSAGATMSRTLTNCTGFDLHFVQGPGQGTFTYQIDGGTAVTVTPNTTGTSNRHDGVITVTGLTLGSHVLQINATNPCIINGVYVLNGDTSTGVRIYNGGKGGTATPDFVASNSGTMWQRVASLGNVNLIAIMLSSNDFSGSIDPSIFKANLYTMIRSAWSNLSTTRPDIVLINSYKRFDHVTYGVGFLYGDYAAKMQELANELDGVHYVDIAGLFPLMNDSVHDPLDLMNTDNIHMNDAGHRYMARILLRRLAPSIL
ncbi:GDSL-type esterase/lipase family protein [Streptomyces sp. MI02-2A]|uniref:GDSL-type esterase/lipase family protein n=1 Tax=Streptomyces sp. MI02-2A TaxID=3028688 RepID=UPI0029B7B0C6|nr:GDSL-type esterase/lipase family protein [Streptomyces sp. MI02-2A]MDX3260694.1 GDSL-type esterase/lipase family protein [Streptomyces sp. MI02-2A]